ALWMRFELPELDPAQRWYLMLDGGAFTDRANFHQANPTQGWREQAAGDHLPVGEWSIPDRTPVFAIDTEQLPGAVWLRLTNEPSPLSPRVYLIAEDELQNKRVWTYLMIGGYLGFGLLVMFIGWVHARLYGDR